MIASKIAKFMGPTWGPLGSCRPLMGPIMKPKTYYHDAWVKYVNSYDIYHGTFQWQFYSKYKSGVLLLSNLMITVTIKCCHNSYAVVTHVGIYRDPVTSNRINNEIGITVTNRRHSDSHHQMYVSYDPRQDGMCASIINVCNKTILFENHHFIFHRTCSVISFVKQ